MTRARTYSYGEELANTISHAAGIVLGIIAGYILLFAAVGSVDSSWKFWTVCVYLVGMLSSYAISTCYHGCKTGAKKQLLQKFDHASIYVHIAGTYTPFTLVVLREEGMWGWAFFTFIWLAAITGVCLSFKRTLKHSRIETACYVIMGGSILIALKPLLDALNATGKASSLYWLLAGGVSYIVGALFYSLAKTKYMHTVFHFFVLGGSVCHIIAIYIVL